MSNLPEQRRLLMEDFSDVDGDWIERLIYPINEFNEQVYNVLNKGINIQDNVQGSVQTVSFTTSGTYTTLNTFTPVILSWAFKTKPVALTIGQIFTTNSSSIITKPTVVTDWYLSGPGSISVRFITGLEDSTKYTVTFIIQ